MWVVWTLALAAAIVLVTGPLHAPWQHLLLRAHTELELGRAKLLAPLHGARDALNQASAAIAGH